MNPEALRLRASVLICLAELAREATCWPAELRDSYAPARDGLLNRLAPLDRELAHRMAAVTVLSWRGLPPPAGKFLDPPPR